MLKKPEKNIIQVSNDHTLKLLLLIVKNHLLYFDTVELHAMGQAIGKSLSAAKLLENEGVLQIEKLQTDVDGEERRYKPMAFVKVSKVLQDQALVHTPEYRTD